MADCSYFRCIQERRLIKRELQKWQKDMVYILGEWHQLHNFLFFHIIFQYLSWQNNNEIMNEEERDSRIQGFLYALSATKKYIFPPPKLYIFFLSLRQSCLLLQLAARLVHNVLNVEKSDSSSSKKRISQTLSYTLLLLLAAQCTRTPKHSRVYWIHLLVRHSYFHSLYILLSSRLFASLLYYLLFSEEKFSSFFFFFSVFSAPSVGSLVQVSSELYVQASNSSSTEWRANANNYTEETCCRIFLFFTFSIPHNFHSQWRGGERKLPKFNHPFFSRQTNTLNAGSPRLLLSTQSTTAVNFFFVFSIQFFSDQFSFESSRKVSNIFIREICGANSHIGNMKQQSMYFTSWKNSYPIFLREFRPKMRREEEKKVSWREDTIQHTPAFPRP